MQSQRGSVVEFRGSGWRWVGRLGVALALVALAQAGGSPVAPRGDWIPWRCPERDGVNCLYLQLRLLGYTGTYESVVNSMPGGPEQASLGGLAQAARRLGFALVPAKLSLTELARLKAPTVILFEEAERGRGRFHLLVGLSSSHASLVDGDFITCGKRMSPDQFRRGWTGFALVPGSHSQWLVRSLGLAAGMGIVGAAGWLASRTARPA